MKQGSGLRFLRFQFVTDLYFSYLQRSPDEGGMGYFLWQLQNCCTRVQVRDGFGASTEFAAIASTVYGVTPGTMIDRVTHYVQGLYLGSAGGSDNWANDLATLQTAAAEGQALTIQTARNIGIARFQGLLTSGTNQEFATKLFHSFLQREPSGTELNTWVTTIVRKGRAVALSAFAALQASQELAGTLYREILWLTTDHLGTLRMISERSGSSAGIKRNDYLPFGEEILAGTGGRITGQGYVYDNVRQQFTSKERDIETGLDYFGARYHSSLQGRFTSPDPLLSSGRPDNPQSWNRYPYTLNNPLCFVDPTGLFTIGSNVSDAEREKIIKAYNKLNEALGKLKVGSKAYKSIERSLARLGKPGVANGVVVTVGSVKFTGGAATDVNRINKGIVTIEFDEKTFSNSSAEDDAANLGHEGVHADDAFNLFSRSRSMAAFAKASESNDVTYRTEYDAYFASAGVYQALQPNTLRSYGNYAAPDVPGKAQNILERLDLWNPSWAKLDIKVIESKQGSTIMTKLEAPDQTPYKLRGYNLTRPKGFQP